ncbi:DUF6082 family protein [Streptomyces sp. 891-h]|uniref:DUF6082 family protein n=1 Tax=Streptomyces sp. 891-h TaxID=2720714 RepID=UPI001FAA6EF8|nr:DUF6082 family protein [Streptomyces sp. 891-h]UNZ18191.1 hypothetical protein HC362_15200 [Streptomyces sp. 891-h]
MKTSHSVLVVSAVGAAGLWLCERQHRRQNALDVAQMHQAWIAEVAENPRLRAAWTPTGGELPDEEYANLLHANRLISFLAAKFRVGLLDKRSLRVQARWLMQREIARSYWKRYGGFRNDEASDRMDRVFNAILSDEYTAVA